MSISESFTPLSSLSGGVLIGLSATLLLLGIGRVAGISGIVTSAWSPGQPASRWRLAFVGGLVAGGLAMALARADSFSPALLTSPWGLALAGLLVGFGARFGSGCTSGHGVCGLSRMSTRSLLATLTFMVTAGLTVFFAGGGE